VKRFKLGDEVYARPDKDRIGAFAEFIALNENDVALKPNSLSMQDAASLPLVGLTAWQALVDHAGLTSGETILVHGAAGGVGVYAVQLAAYLGGRVIATDLPEHAQADVEDAVGVFAVELLEGALVAALETLREREHRGGPLRIGIDEVLRQESESVGAGFGRARVRGCP
jgi:NADPH:quinone reductase-like Zn-dependent oxidoreductase